MRRIDLSSYALDGSPPVDQYTWSLVIVAQAATEAEAKALVEADLAKAKANGLYSQGRLQKVEGVVYDVRNSCIEVLFSPQLQLSARQVLDRDDLARKIRDCPDSAVLLEETEYQILKGSLDSVTGLGRNDVQFVRRIYAAPEVQVTAKG